MSRIALVTGAGSGMGRAAAIAFAREGYAVVLAGRRTAPLNETAAQLEVPCLVVPTDVSDPAQVRSLFSQIKEKFGRLDLLFNNAGVLTPATALEDLSFEQWQSAVGANLTGAFLCTQEAVRIMKTQSPRGGRIINNGSVSATVPRPRAAAYTATKHGLTGLTKATALEGRGFDIACGQIDVGNAATDMTERMTSGVLQPDGRMAAEPLMDLDDAIRAIVYMASLPLSANVLFMTVMATAMPLVGRG